VIDPIEAHYDRFPYPDVKHLVVTGTAEHVVGSLSFALRRRSDTWISQRGSVWIAGCGTLQAAEWGLALPDAEILATDVSERALEIAAATAREAGAKNVRFERRDLRLPMDRSFDLVVCTGVVHHLPDPALALRSVRDALAPNGALVLMVYSRAHRAPLDPVRRAIARLGLVDYEEACAVLGAAIGARCRPDQRDMLEALWQLRKRDPSFVADVILNPREASYDMPALYELLAAAGLRFGEWRYPGGWRLRYYADDPAFVARGEALGPRGEAELVYHLGGVASPMLDVLVERDDAPERPPYSTGELLDMRMAVRADDRQLDFEQGRVVREHRFPSFEVGEGAVRGRASSGHGSDRHFAVGEQTLPFIAACDGTATVRELAARFVDLAPEELFLALVTDLSPRDVGLLAPRQ
jgi:SAM-dependent methyltransferase